MCEVEIGIKNYDDYLVEVIKQVAISPKRKGCGFIFWVSRDEFPSLQKHFENQFANLQIVKKQREKKVQKPQQKPEKALPA